jgi:nitrite reductase (NADH) large subunit
MKQASGSKRPKLVVLGNGMAAGRVLDELFARAPDRYDVTIFGAEPRVNYDRIMLSPVLAGEKRFDDIIVHSDDWYARHRVDLRKGETVVAIDPVAQTVRTQSGVVERYDALIIAVGSRPILIPVPGVELPGVVTFRDLDDVNAMLAAAQRVAVRS